MELGIEKLEVMLSQAVISHDNNDNRPHTQLTAQPTVSFPINIPLSTSTRCHVAETFVSGVQRAETPARLANWTLPRVHDV